MKRFLKRHISRFLPEALRASVKRRLSAKFVCENDLANWTDTPEGRAEFHSLARAARVGGVLFNIGAHSGLISAMFCAAEPQNQAFTFEPSSVLAIVHVVAQ